MAEFSKPAPPPSIYISASPVDRDLQQHLRELLRELVPDAEVVEPAESIAAASKWSDWITDQLAKSTHVFVILTAQSIERPWMTWEQGVIHSSAKNARVFPLAFGIDIRQVPFPFQEFQITQADDRDSLIRLARYLREDLGSGRNHKPGQLEALVDRFVAYTRTALVQRGPVEHERGGYASPAPSAAPEPVRPLEEKDAQMLCELLFKLVVRLRERPEMLQSVEPTAFWAAVRKVKPSATTLDDLRAVHADLSGLPAPGSLWASWMRTVRTTELAAIVRHAGSAPAQSAS